MKIIITERQFKLIVEQTEYYKQLQMLIKNDNLELAIELASSVNTNIEDVFKDLLMKSYSAYDGLYYNFSFEINDVDIMDINELSLVLNISHMTGTYFFYDGNDEQYIDINNLIEGDNYLPLETIIESSLIEEFPFLEEYTITLTFFD